MYRLLSTLSILAFFVLLSGQSAFAQRPNGPRPEIGVLSGTVLDARDESVVEFATITLVSMRDSSIVTGSITDKKGSFLITEIPLGMYNVKVTFIGYEIKTIGSIRLTPKESTTRDLGEIMLAPLVNDLEAAEVTADAPYMEMKMDKRVFNVEESWGTTGGSATDIIETLPSVQVDIDGNISLRGSQNVTILIDGKPSALTGTSRQAIMEQIPASSIERIEIITNPSAKYDPDGMSGIINVVLKKNKLAGFNGNVSLTAGTGDQYNGSLGLNYRNNKVNVFTNYSYRYSDLFSRSETNRTTFGDDERNLFLIQNADGARIGENHTIMSGVDLYLNPTLTLSASGTLNLGETGSQDSVQNLQEYASGFVLSNFNRHSNSERNNRGYDLNLGLVKQFKGDQHAWTTDIRYSDAQSDQLNTFDNLDYLIGNDVLNFDTPEEYNNSNSTRNTLTAQTDYVRPVHDGDGKIELGYKVIIQELQNDFYGYAQDSISGDYAPQLDRNNSFVYDEQIHGAYATYGRKINRFSFLFGLRAEEVLTTSTLITTNEVFNNDYFSLFPSSHLSYDVTEATQLGLSYSRRINRPRSRQLNPFPNYSNVLSLRKGNPFLLPEYTNSFELAYSIQKGRSSYMISAYLRDVNNVIRRFKTVDTSGVSTTTYENFAGAQNYGIELVINTPINKWWSINASANGYRTKNDGTNLESDLNNEAYSWSAQIMSTMTFKKGLSIQLSGFYRAPELYPQGSFNGFLFSNIALKKSILKSKGSLTLNLRDIFDTREFSFDSNGEGFEEESMRKRESRNLLLTFSYRFGKLEPSKGKRKRSSGDNGGGEMDDGDF